MDKVFRLYGALESNYFDLIKGDKETQQTKGLGLLLSKSEIALKSFLTIPAIQEKIGKIKLDTIDRIIINCEPISKSEIKFRGDILIRMYENDKPFKAILVEAKSANKAVSVSQATNQVEKYLNGNVFKQLNGFENKTYGITLTKLSRITNHPELISITWMDVIKSLYDCKSNKNDLLDDYFKFLTNINGTMKFYESEVYSIPTAKWSNTAIQNFGIYECPNEGRYIIKKKPLYITFRKSGGGEMDRLYKVDDILVLNFHKDFEAFLESDQYLEKDKRRVEEYKNYMLDEGIWGNLPKDDKQVFILSEKTIELPHKPKPKKNNSYRAYYELADLINNKEL